MSEERSRLRAELETLIPEAGLAAAHRSWRTVAEVRRWCQRALAQTHLVDVAHLLSTRGGLDLPTMEELGVPVDLLELFPEWRAGLQRGFRPPSESLCVPALGAGHAIEAIRLQMSPSASVIARMLVLIRDLLRATDDDTRLLAVFEPTANVDGVRELVDRFAGGERVDLVGLPTQTSFAQDNGRLMLSQRGEPVLLVPRAFEGARARDEIATAWGDVLGMPVVRSRLFFDGGNVINDDHSIFIGADTIARNMVRLGLTEPQVLALFRAELGAPIHVLGALRADEWARDLHAAWPSGQASFHIDLDVALLGRFGDREQPSALIADVALGLEHADHATEARANNAALPAELTASLLYAQYEDSAHRRLPQLIAYHDVLVDLGYQVVGVPDLRIESEHSVLCRDNPNFSYCNVVPGLRSGRPSVFYLPWGIPVLDALAEIQFRTAGVEPHRVSDDAELGNAFMNLKGGLHCLCGPWAAR